MTVLRVYVSAADLDAVRHHMMHVVGFTRFGYADVPGGHVVAVHPIGGADRMHALAHPAVTALPHVAAPVDDKVAALFPHVKLPPKATGRELYAALQAANPHTQHPLLEPDL